MTDESHGPQLLLPSLTIERPPTTLRGLVASMKEAHPFDALVHLRCPGCQWRRTLRLPRARTRRIEGLLPRVPVRHWVFSLGESAQPRLAAHPGVRTRVARACVAAVFAWLRRAAAREGIAPPVRCGAVSAIHRVGAALETNVHVHALVLDGVYTHPPAGSLVFHPVPPPRRRDLRRTLAELRHTLDAILATVPPEPPPCTRTRATHRAEMGPVVHPVPPPSSDGALIQRCGELDVRAGPVVDGDDHPARNRLCRYVARLPFDPRALDTSPEGRLRYRLRHPFADGTTHVELSPRALAERLESLATGGWRPPIAFHGVVAPAVAQRQRQLSLLDEPRPSRARPRASTLRCPRCRGPLEVVGVESVERAA